MYDAIGDWLSIQRTRQSVIHPKNKAKRNTYKHVRLGFKTSPAEPIYYQV